MNDIEIAALAARAASAELARSSNARRTTALREMSRSIYDFSSDILSANAMDIMLARRDGMEESFVDRLMINEARLLRISNSLEDMARQDDPLTEKESESILDNGLVITRARVPLGVVGAIYESRPVVTTDIAALCIKSGNACVLRGGKKSEETNKVLAAAIKRGLAAAGLPPECVMHIEDTSQESAQAMMRCRGYIDLLITRGGRSLIDSVLENATVPVIQAGSGNCHIFVDSKADFDMACAVIIDAKLSHPTFSSSVEKLLIHKDIAAEFVPMICRRLNELGCEIRVDTRAEKLYKIGVPMRKSDYITEYNDMIISVMLTDSREAAIAHINHFSSGYSDCIITSDSAAAEEFLNGVDSAVVYHNASTQFSDTADFGPGAAVGLATGKLHLRGPFTQKALTTVKYVVRGDGQLRK